MMTRLTARVSHRDQAAGRVEGDHEGHDERQPMTEARTPLEIGVLGQRRADLVLALHDEGQVERVVQDVGQVEGLALGEVSSISASSLSISSLTVGT
jgi:hypothetical protein